jgi:hypothetical protein
MEGGPPVFVWKGLFSVADFVSSSLGDSRPWKVKQEGKKTVPAKIRPSEHKNPRPQEKFLQSKP